MIICWGEKLRIQARKLLLAFCFVHAIYVLNLLQMHQYLIHPANIYGLALILFHLSTVSLFWIPVIY